MILPADARTETSPATAAVAVSTHLRMTVLYTECVHELTGWPIAFIDTVKDERITSIELPEGNEEGGRHTDANLNTFPAVPPGRT